MTLGVCYHADKSILDELETTEFRLGQTKINRVAIIKFIMNKCCGHRGCSFQIKIIILIMFLLDAVYKYISASCSIVRKIV